jgi:Flp pilus assembly protein TadG
MVAGRTDRGSTSIQMVLLMPALFSILFLGMQGALYYHARTVAIASAQEGARAAAGENGSAAAGAGAARSFIADAGGDGVLPRATVTGSRSATTATVTVRGRAMSVIAGWSLGITARASAPVERITR